MTQQQIAEYVSSIDGQKKMHQSAVSDLLRGDIEDPSYTRGEILVKLHAMRIHKVKPS